MGVSAGFELHNCELVGVVEKERELEELAEWWMSSGVTTGDFYDYEWKRWKHLIGEVDVLVGGFPCVFLSKAGKQLMHRDWRSGCLMETVLMCGWLDVRAVLLENVTELVDKDGEHGLLTDADVKFLEDGMVQVHVWRQKHSECGGSSQRVRVLPSWVKKEVARVSAPVVTDWQSVNPGRVLEHLRGIEEVPDWCVVDGEMQWISTKTVKAGSYDANMAGWVRYWKEQPVVEGSVVQMGNDRRWWVVELICSWGWELFWDDRERPSRMCTWETLRAVGYVHGERWEKVFSVEAPSITIRNMSLPFARKGMLIWDPRLSRVRWLLGDELASIMEVDDAKVRWLLQRGVPLHEVGKMAGNAVPVSMVERPAGEITAMLRLFDDMEETARMHGVPVMMAEAPAVAMDDIFKMVLVPVAVRTMEVWLPPVSESVWGLVRHGQVVRESARQWGIRTVQQSLWGVQAAMSEVELAADFEVRGVRTVVVVWVSTIEPRTERRCGMHDIMSETLRMMMMPALVKAGVMRGVPIEAAALFSAKGMGSIPIQMLEAEEVVEVPDDTKALMSRNVERLRRAHDELVWELQQVPCEHECYETMQQWIDRIASVSMDEVLEDLHEHARSFSEDVLRCLPFSARVRAPITSWPVKVCRGVPRPKRLPRSIHDILKPWAYDLRRRWYREQIQDMVAMCEDPEGYVRKCNWICVIGESGFYDDMFGTIFDFSVVVDGFIQPMDLDSEIEHTLNVDYMEQEMPGHVDKEIFWMLRYGATYKADLAYQIVLNHHLVSLKNGC